MAGHIAATAPHLDGRESIGIWVDVAWAAYAEIAMKLDRDRLDFLEERWSDLATDLDENGKPTPEQWGASEKAQQGQAALMAMLGGGPDMGAAPGVGEEG